MYSVVMMMALSGTAEAPECGRLLRWGCHGCSGYTGCSGCYGSYSCSGCSGYTGCSGCHGWRHGCSGCYGSCTGCYGSYGYYAPIVVPAAPPAPPMMAPPPPPGAALPLPSQTRVPATIQVNIPSDAVIYFDGYRTTATGNRRYTTPALEQGKTYFYNVRIEMNRDGQTVTATERVIVRAGGQAQVSVNVTPAGALTAHQD